MHSIGDGWPCDDLDDPTRDCNQRFSVTKLTISYQLQPSIKCPYSVCVKPPTSSVNCATFLLCSWAAANASCVLRSGFMSFKSAIISSSEFSLALSRSFSDKTSRSASSRCRVATRSWSRALFNCTVSDSYFAGITRSRSDDKGQILLCRF